MSAAGFETCRRHGRGRPRLLLVAGPPFSGALYDPLLRFLRFPAWTVAPRWERLEPGPEGLLRGLLELLEGMEPRPALLGHLYAAPLVAAVPPELRSGLVLCNGPLSRLDPLALLLSRLARLPGGLPLSQPGLLRAWLHSPLGLPRLLVNPYVLGPRERRLLLRPALEQPAAAEGLRAFFRGLPAWLAGLRPQRGAGPFRYLWGGDDALYPLPEPPASLPPPSRDIHVTVPGGRALFLLERPLAVADELNRLFAGEGEAWDRDTDVVV